MISIIFIMIGIESSATMIGFILNCSSSNVAKLYKNQVNDEKVKLTQLQLQLKEEGQLEDAIHYYEQVIEEGSEGSHPFDRLMILCCKQKKYDNEIRIIQQTITHFN